MPTFTPDVEAILLYLLSVADSLCCMQVVLVSVEACVVDNYGAIPAT